MRGEETIIITFEKKKCVKNRMHYSHDILSGVTFPFAEALDTEFFSVCI